MVRAVSRYAGATFAAQFAYHWVKKTTCSYLNAINKQEKKKFVGTDISGILNIQCSHVFVVSTVDLQYGER
jgi:hypothetical protein